MISMRYEWDVCLSVNSKEIDTQHRDWLRIMNDLHFAMLQGKGRAKIGILLDKLRDCSVKHFLLEESYMTKMAYPDINAHKNKHIFFVSKIKEFAELAENSPISLPMQVMRFLDEWVLDHIRIDDIKYAEFEKNRLRVVAH